MHAESTDNGGPTTLKHECIYFTGWGAKYS